jgi:hypothetical protein
MVMENLVHASMVAVKVVERGAKTNKSLRRLPSIYIISMVAIKYLFTLV